MLPLVSFDNYLALPEVKARLATAPLYFKTGAFTLLRLPTEKERGSVHTTYIKDAEDERGYSQEVGGNVITSESILARNAEVLGVDEQGLPVHNEWIIAKPVALQNYGIQAIESLNAQTFTACEKKAGLRAFQVTEEFLKALGVQGKSMSFTVAWTPEPMTVKVGGFLTDKGYSISEEDFKAYAQAPSETPPLPRQLNTRPTEESIPPSPSPPKMD